MVKAEVENKFSFTRTGEVELVQVSGYLGDVLGGRILIESMEEGKLAF